MFKLKKIQKNRGMTYVELIVVLSIFAIMSAMVMYNYGAFQAKVDVKNLTSDVALQIVTAQKSSLSGLLPPTGAPSLTWKPSYGVYFNSSTSTDTDGVPFNKKFLYFVDLDQSGTLADPTCSGSSECLNRITITKGDSISGLTVVNQNNIADSLNDLTVTFSRPSSGAVLFSMGEKLLNISYVQIVITSLNGSLSAINVFPSGRIQIGTPVTVTGGGYQYGSGPNPGGGGTLGGGGNVE